MRAGNGETIYEPVRQVPVYGHADVLVVGGGPAGCAAAIAAARTGADVVLLERYGHLGGLSTGGLVCWIDRMTDWEGRLVVGGIGQELIERCGLEQAVLGPPRSLWGSRDPHAVAYWSIRASAHRGVVTWAPTVDPEVLTCVLNDLVREARGHVLFHCWAVAAVSVDGRVRGILFESKEGRRALLAGVTVDCTGDGDIFASAGALYESDIDSTTIHARVNTSFRFGNVDMRRYLDFRLRYPEQHATLLRQAAAEGIELRVHATPYDSVALFMTPKFSGYSAIRVQDLTEVEFRSRDAARRGLAWFRAHMPGFERAWLLDTAQQIGTRHSRRLNGPRRLPPYVLAREAGSRQRFERRLVVAQHVAQEQVEHAWLHICVDCLVDRMHEAMEARPGAVVVEHRLEVVGIVHHLGEIVLSAVERCERVLVPDMPADRLLRSDRLCCAVDLLAQTFEAVVPEAFPGQDLRIAQQQPKEGDVHAIHRPLASSQTPAELIELEVPRARPFAVDALLFRGGQTVAAEAVRHVCRADRAALEQVHERALPLRPVLQAVDGVALEMVFYDAEPPVDIVGVAKARQTVPAAKDIHLKDFGPVRHVAGDGAVGVLIDPGKNL